MSHVERKSKDIKLAKLADNLSSRRPRNVWLRAAIALLVDDLIDWMKRERNSLINCCPGIGKPSRSDWRHESGQAGYRI
jgi:hypothetical protein